MSRPLAAFAAVMVLFGLFPACAVMTPRAQTPEESNYMSRVRAQPLVFEVPKAQAADVWGRIQSFVGKYSSMKIQTATDYVIETFDPGAGAVSFGYKAIRTDKGAAVEFSFGCFCGNMFAQASTETNAGIFSLYAETGEIMERFVIR